jgi:hypothetical protein
MVSKSAGSVFLLIFCSAITIIIRSCYRSSRNSRGRGSTAAAGSDVLLNMISTVNLYSVYYCLNEPRLLAPVHFSRSQRSAHKPMFARSSNSKAEVGASKSPKVVKLLNAYPLNFGLMGKLRYDEVRSSVVNQSKPMSRGSSSTTNYRAPSVRENKHRTRSRAFSMAWMCEERCWRSALCTACIRQRTSSPVYG